MKSIAGTEVLWKTPKKSWLGLRNVHEIFPSARGEGNRYVVEGIVAGDNREKGLSIVAIENGIELTCVMPGVTDEQWNVAIKIASTGVWDTEKAQREIEGRYIHYTDQPHCPYK